MVWIVKYENRASFMGNPVACMYYLDFLLTTTAAFGCRKSVGDCSKPNYKIVQMERTQIDAEDESITTLNKVTGVISKLQKKSEIFGKKFWRYFCPILVAFFVFILEMLLKWSFFFSRWTVTGRTSSVSPSTQSTRTSFLTPETSKIQLLDKIKRRVQLLNARPGTSKF